MGESFKEFFLTRNPEMRKIYQVIQEMSAQITEYRDILKDNYENLVITKKVVEEGDYIGTFEWNQNKLEIYEYDFSETGTDERKLFFVLNKQITYVKLFFFEHKGAAYINDVNSRGGDFRRIVPEIYIRYLLTRNDRIISDNIQTRSGFNMYRYMLLEKERYDIVMNVLDVRTNKEIPINDVTELEKYFGDATEFVNYRFVIRKK